MVFVCSTDVITKEEAIQMLRDGQAKKAERLEILKKNGYPAYTTQVGWMGYNDDKVKTLCRKYLQLGFTSFKAKVGVDLNDDIRRCGLIRDVIGYENKLMVDANQVWDVQEAIDWMKQLAKFKPVWIEEPTSPDDVLGHAKIAQELRPYGIGVATGEMCANRVIFKQLLQLKAIDFCQIDSARIGGINEILAVYFMAKKTGGTVQLYCYPLIPFLPILYIYMQQVSEKIQSCYTYYNAPFIFCYVNSRK